MNDFNLATAGKSELKEFAINELNLKLSLSMNEATMRQKILDKCSELGIEPPKAKMEATKGAAAKEGQKMFIINIANSDKPDGDEPVPVGVQGTLYTIPRGIDIEVPECVVEALRNAKQDHVTQDADGELIHNDVQAYPFNIVGMAA